MEVLQETIQKLIAAMTVEEKIKLLAGGSSFGSQPIDRLGIPRIQYLDGGTGMNWEQLMGDWMPLNTGTVRKILTHFNEPESLSKEQQEIRKDFLQLLEKRGCSQEQPGCYPPGILLGATWNPETVYHCGQALGQEALDYHVDILLGTPNVNLHRDPRNGRLFEGYSEDPCLISALAPELVKGVQESGVLANVKHFAANNLEAYRQGVDEHIPERVLRELYLPGFFSCVTEGQVKTLMTAYNRINGTACTEHTWLIQEILRKEWGFGDRLVISDWGAVYNPPAAIQAGNDVEMPGPSKDSRVSEALEQGTLSEADLDRAVSHMLMAIAETPAGKASGLFPGLSPEKAGQTEVFPSSFRREAAYRVVTEGTVLLKNEDSLLPLPKYSRIALIGKESASFHDCGDGSARVYTNKTTSLLEELSKDPDYYCQYMDAPTAGCLDTFDAAVLTVYVPGQEGRDRAGLTLSQAQQKTILKCIQESKASHTPLILLLNVCGPVDLRFCEPDIAAILCMFFPGMEGGRGIKDLLTGAVNPSGKLPLTFPKRIEDTPAYLNPPSPDWSINYGEGLYVGYRYYDKKKLEPLYPFGYGLSYTTFELTTPEPVSLPPLTSEDTVSLTCRLTNTGRYSGSEVVQLYAEAPGLVLDKPVRELKAFQKHNLQPGETRDLTFHLPVSSLAAFDPAYKKWAVEPGEYRFRIGTSSRQLLPAISVWIQGDACYSFHSETPFIRILEHPLAYPALLSACEAYGVTESDFQGFAVYTPYFSCEQVVTGVLGKKLPPDTFASAKETIYGLLKQYSTSSSSVPQ